MSAYTTRELLASGSQGQTAVTESVALLHTAPVNTLDTLDLFNAELSAERYWGGGGGAIYLTLHCPPQNDFCIKIVSHENPFNVSFIVRGKVTRHCP